ncbi:MAG TPA: acyl carrier protein [Gemmatimonadaceae bacterium]|nr:acyl carrier protein [Vicinamibacterales bacterium]
MDSTEQQVIDVVSAVTKTPPERITPETDLRLDLNVDSLQGLQILAALEKRFDVELADEDLDAHTSVRSIVDAMRRARRVS